MPKKNTPAAPAPAPAPVPDNSGDDVDQTEQTDDTDALLSPANTQLVIDQGLKDLQTTIYEHASRIKPRLARQDKIIDLIESRIFQPDMLEALPSKELVKLFELLIESQAQAAGFIERLYKMTLQRQDIDIVSLSKAYALGVDGTVTEKSAARIKMDPERKALLLKVIEHNLVDNQDLEDDGD